MEEDGRDGRAKGTRGRAIEMWRARIMQEHSTYDTRASTSIYRVFEWMGRNVTAFFRGVSGWFGRRGKFSDECSAKNLDPFGHEWSANPHLTE
jgi:hypothetical protein